MIVRYKPTIVESIRTAVEKAKAEGREIQEIVLTCKENEELQRLVAPYPGQPPEDTLYGIRIVVSR